MTDLPSRLTTALADRYRIERQLGEGGMATVYLAEDLKHDRKVAIKVLKPELAVVVGAERFLGEIRTTANLQHPHILPLFDSGEVHGQLFFVMPYVEGETLADRIAQDKQLPVDEAVRLATAVAGALQVAHDRGVIHRDIKPANILLSGGQPLVADFGIALAAGAGGTRLTETGLSVGTPYYMSPEQATGDQVIGPAADIYALACVLYEMLVGEPPYLGNTAQAVLGKIIQGLPVSATAARKTVPANVDAAIRKALEKLPADRFTRAADFAAALSDPSFRHGAEAGAAGAAGDAGRWRMLAFAAMAVAVVSLVAGALGFFGSAPESGQVLRQKIAMPSIGPTVRWGLMMALAPDGSGMVYLDVNEDGQRALYYKARQETEGTPLPDTDDVDAVAFSPDGTMIVFNQRGNLVTRPVRGGAATTLATGVDQATPGLDWLSDGTILYEISDGDQVGRIPGDGSAPTDTIVRMGSLRWVHGIEGHESALVLRCPGCDLGVVDLESGELVELLRDVARAWYVPTGHIVYVRSDGAVYATPFDPETREMGAIGTPLFEGVRTGNGWADMVLGEDGTMIYVSGSGTGGGKAEVLTWVDRDGSIEVVDPTWNPQDLDPAVLSPDGRRLAVGVASDASMDVVVHELPDGPRTRLTAGDGRYFQPTWTPDGRSLVYLDLTGDSASILRLRADGSSPTPDTLFGPVQGDFGFPQFTPDGKGIVFADFRVGNRNIGFLEVGSDSIVTLFGTDFVELAPTVSPDGRWLAYTSNITGELEVFVRPFPDVMSGRTQVSNGGGVEPVWAKGGGELFYRNETSLVAAAYRADSTFVVESRTELFEFGENRYIVRLGGRSYDVDATGKRFLTVRYPGASADGPEVPQANMILVQNWFAELRQRLTGGNR
ncbi:MAG TPA: protein kinase [Longimicrobiales bacterium]|nr:protein kinase [Longimicrobiales bacterium]